MLPAVVGIGYECGGKGGERGRFERFGGRGDGVLVVGVMVGLIGASFGLGFYNSVKSGEETDAEILRV